VGHYIGHGTTAAAMVHRVITIYEDICCVLYVCCRGDCVHVTNTVRGQYLPVVASVGSTTPKSGRHWIGDKKGGIIEGAPTFFLCNHSLS
jgi:hypothetical protein